MKARLWILVPCILIILIFAQARSVAAVVSFVSGNRLVELMREHDRDDPQAIEAGEYGVYILGVCDATRLLYNIPEKATIGQIAAIVSKYLKDHPEKWGEPASDLVIKALQEAFPLKK
jgi:hypothetical protein